MLGKNLWNDGWEFYKAEFGTPTEQVLTDCMDNNVKKSETGIAGGIELFKKVNIPHDWLIYQGQDLYEDSTGFYRKNFEFDKNSERRYEIYFEGVYMDTTVYVNGKEVGQWKYGYSSFFFDITNELKSGTNCVLVRVDFKAPNSRWYSGAGIYRNVWFIEKPATHFVTDSLYISASPSEENAENGKKTRGLKKSNAESRWNVLISAELAGGFVQRSSGLKNFYIRLDIPEAGISEDFEAYNALYTETDEGYQQVRLELTVNNPRLWEIGAPALYHANLTLIRKKAESEYVTGSNVNEDNAGSSIYESDSCESVFGFRTIKFDCNKGFFLNGSHVKIFGACEHHDLGAIGAAFNKEAMRRKLVILREMGVNAIRTSHNMPAPELLGLTDEMGFLVMDESFDMWEWPKTEFDYARFFKDWQATDVRSWIRRDRNHPSVIMWSIGNEIYDTHASAHGQEITKMLMDEARFHDPLGNAVIGMASNYMQWEGAQKCSDILKFGGYNYAERLYDEHHEKYPDWCIFGSETSSTLQSRGVYHFPYSQPGMADADEQCSSLGNCTATWGAKNSEYCINMDLDRDFSFGQFIWSGFDYIGEPTPYQTRNCYFGQIDTAGFFKDTAYLYRAAWTSVSSAPFVHIMPQYWDFNEGQLIDVRVSSNASNVLLMINGRPLGKSLIDHKKGQLTADYIVPYEKGVLSAVAYDDAGREIAKDERHSFTDPVKIVAKLHYSKAELTAGCADMAFIEVGTVDAQGNVVGNDNTAISVEVSGAGWLAGLDNGDSTDFEEYKGHTKRLFFGKMLAMIAAGSDPGIIKVSFSAYENDSKIEGTELVIKVNQAPKKEGISLLPEILFTGKAVKCEGGKKPVNTLENGTWIRKIDLKPEEKGQTFEKGTDDIWVSAEVSPYSAVQKIEWSAVTDSGIAAPCAKVVEIVKTPTGERARIHAIGDGAFRVRALTRNGVRMAKVISELEFKIEDHGQATVNPYELVPGAMCSRHVGELGNAIEHGIASADGYSVITFDNLDFGSFGSDEISVPVFELGGNPCPIEIWEGMPGEDGAEKLYDTVYQKASIWNTYQADTYKLPRRVSGITTISLVFRIKVNVGGIKFNRLEKAYCELKGCDRDAVFGDSFREEGSAIRDIGNNVTIEYSGMNFEGEGATKLNITGYTPKPGNTIHVVFGDGESQFREIIEFAHSEGTSTQEFNLDRVTTEKMKGSTMVRFIFLPGSKFDLESFRFE